MLVIDEHILVRYVTGECTPEEFSAVKQWLNESEENRRKLFELEEIWNSGKATRFDIPLLVRSELDKWNRRVDAFEAGRRRNHRFFRRAGGYAAAGIAVLCVLTVSLWWFNRHAGNGSQERGYVSISVTEGEGVKLVVLDDSTHVWLNETAVLVYPERFAAGERKVQLVGEAYFEVTPDAARPFFVETHAFTIKVTGTSFNVSVYRDANFARAALDEGSIVLEGLKSGQQLTMSPGELAELNLNTGRINVEKVTPGVRSAWRYGLHIFEDASLEEIASELEKIYRIKVGILSPEIKAYRYAVTIDRKNPVETALQMLEFSGRITWNIKDSTVSIRKK